MIRLFLFSLLLFPFLGTAQVVDSARVRVELDSLVQLNRKLVGERNFEAAFRVIEAADSMALLAFGENSALYATCLFNHGRTYYFKRNYKEAEFLYLKALSLQENLLGKNHADYAWSLNNLAIIYTENRNFDKAESMFIESKNIRKKVLGEEHPLYISSLNNLATLYYKNQKYNMAEPLFIESLRLGEKIMGKEHPDYASTLANLGALYYNGGYFDKAEPLYNESKEIIEKSLGNMDPRYANVLMNLASLYRAKGYYEKSEQFYLESKTVLENSLGKEHPDYALLLYSLAALLDDKGDYKIAEELYIKAKNILISTVGTNNQEFMRTLNGLGILYYNKGEYTKAEKIYLQSKNIAEKVLGSENPDYSRILNDLGNIYSEIGEFSKAESSYLESQKMGRNALGEEHPDYISSLINLANLYRRVGNYEKSKNIMEKHILIQEKVLGVEHPEYALSLFNLGSLYVDLQIYDKAEKLYTKAYAIRKKILGQNHPDYVASSNNLARLYKITGQLSQSQLLFTESSNRIKNIILKSSRYLPNQELESYLTFFGRKIDNFYSFNHTIVTDPYLIASYNFSLFYKGFVLETAAHLEQAIQSAPDSIRDIHSRWKGYNRLLAAELALPIAERKHFAYLDSMSNVLEKTLLRASSDFAEAQRQIEWQDVQKALQPGEAAIEFIHYRYFDKQEADSTMYSALVTIPDSKAPLFIPLCEARQLDALIYIANGTRANYLQNLYASMQADGQPSLNQLIWSPIEKVLGENGIKTVYYSPSGMLHRLNLGSMAEGKSGARLADRYKLVPMGSTRNLVMDRSGSEHITLEDAVIFGGVRYEMDSIAISNANLKWSAFAQDTTGGLFSFALQPETPRGENWNYLPGTEKEARYLDGLLRRRNIHTTLRLGYEATEESFKQIGQNGPSPSLLHIGTHGFFFPDPQDTSRRRASLTGNEPAFKISEFSMIRSGLKLAGSRYAWENGHPLPGGHEDGILTAYEVSQMNLSNTQLVVLSACETGLGDIRGNEGVYGLQRAFRIAGAKNVLMSLWKVPDDATEKLMTRFYTHWLSE
ncbi:MAG: CHAT domain-containing protein, partial [Saprospiraceae bacterium]|nr:CHAT domain-containing protein [Saprospiraceae bacterium]